MQLKKVKLLLGLLISMGSSSLFANGIYASCQLTSGDYRYFSTCKYFSSIEQGINFCNNAWYNYIGTPELTHVRSFVTSDSNNSMEGCKQLYKSFLNRNRPFSDNKLLISTEGNVNSYRMERDVIAEDRMDI
ncbi:MAG: hypothetical protein U0T83_02925 [Bacteriovoracaceae bacterium]